MCPPKVVRTLLGGPAKGVFSPACYGFGISTLSFPLTCWHPEKCSSVGLGMGSLSIPLSSLLLHHKCCQWEDRHVTSVGRLIDRPWLRWDWRWCRWLSPLWTATLTVTPASLQDKCTKCTRCRVHLTKQLQRCLLRHELKTIGSKSSEPQSKTVALVSEKCLSQQHPAFNPASSESNSSLNPPNCSSRTSVK